MAVISANKAKLKCRASISKPRGQRIRRTPRGGEGPARSPGFQDRSPGAGMSPVPRGGNTHGDGPDPIGRHDAVPADEVQSQRGGVRLCSVPGQTRPPPIRLGRRTAAEGRGRSEAEMVGASWCRQGSPIRLGSGLDRYQTGPNSKFKFKFKKMKNSQKISKNTSRCDESNGVKFSQKFVHLV